MYGIHSCCCSYKDSMHLQYALKLHVHAAVPYAENLINVQFPLLILGKTSDVNPYIVIVIQFMSYFAVDCVTESNLGNKKVARV